MGTRFQALMARLKPLLLALFVNLALLAFVDLMLVKLDLLSPPFQYGMADVGFGFSGVRQSDRLGVPSMAQREDRITITMVGDSHSQLIFPNQLDTHEFVLERALRDEGYPVQMISAGRGRYSPLQEYVLFKRQLKDRFKPDLLLMNVYAGNDFYDMLRPDDRPHYARDKSGAIVTKPPEWISFVDPESRSWVQRSRLLWGVDEVASRLGYPRVFNRLRMLGAAALQSEGSPAETVRYLTRLARSQDPRLEYPAAFAAQILNQALYFRHFPAAKAESIAFMRRLLEQVRAENPELQLVMASIPSAAVMDAIPKDVQQPWKDTLVRSGLDAKWVADVENTLVDELGASAASSGWLFIDLRDCLRGRSAGGELYASTDLHINATASRMIGECQAQALISRGVIPARRHDAAHAKTGS